MNVRTVESPGLYVILNSSYQVSMEPDIPEDKSNLSFKQVVDKCTNLLTVIGIFNAISIYSATIPSSAISKLLSVIFLLLSILMLHEVLLFAIRIPNSSFANKYEKLKVSIFLTGIYLSEALIIIFTMKEYWSVITIGTLGVVATISSGFILYSLFLSSVSSGTDWKALIKYYVFAVIILAISIVLLYILRGQIQKLGFDKL